jgi:hypothetical protein
VTIHTDLADNYLPPQEGATIVLTVNTSSIAWNLHSVNLGPSLLSSRAPTSTSEFYLDLVPESANIYFLFTDNASAVISETNAVAAASAPNIALDAQHCQLLPTGGKGFKISRKADKYLILKGDGAGKVRLHVSSQANPDERKG